MVIFLIAFSAILLLALIGALEQVHHLRVQLHMLRKKANRDYENDQH